MPDDGHMTCEIGSCPLLLNTFFAKLPPEQISRLGCIFRLGRYHKNQIIFAEGGSAQQILALRSGLVKLVKLLENGKERIVRIVFPGELFGIEGLTDANYALTSVTLSESEICVTTPHEFFEFLRRDPEVTLNLVRFLVGEIGKVRRQVTDMSFKDARMKVATFLMTVTSSNHAPAAKGVAMTLPFSRQEISEILELSPETISRILSSFRKDRLIEARGRQLTIRDRSALAKEAQR
jgi:CRP/FNR family transcriptional regulator